MDSPVSYVSDNLVMVALNATGECRLMSGNSSFISAYTACMMEEYTHTLYPIILLVLFIGLLATHGIVNASADPSVTRPPPNVTGPGGKPLPDTRAARNRRLEKPSFTVTQKLSFIWISAILIMTFFGNATNIVVHALVEEWWCGEAAAVSAPPAFSLYKSLTSLDICRWVCFSVLTVPSDFG